MSYGVLIGFELLLQHEILRKRMSVRCAFRIFQYQYRYTEQQQADKFLKTRIQIVISFPQVQKDGHRIRTIKRTSGPHSIRTNDFTQAGSSI